MFVSIDGWVPPSSVRSAGGLCRVSRRSRNLSLVVGLLLLVAYQPARAWNFDEHFEVATRAYTRACADLCSPSQASSPLSEKAVQRIHLACGPCRLYEESPALGAYPGCDQVLNAERSFASSRLAEKISAGCQVFVSSGFPREAIVFGQSCAIAGDHLSHPRELGEDLSGRRAASPARFLRQVLQNRKHFAPDALRQYKDRHADAIGQALGKLPPQGAATTSSRLDRARAWEAFACHFLQDSFAAGHLGFNRGASSNTPSRLFHNHWNRLGRCVRNAPDDEPWAAFGDGKLCREDNAENLCRLSEATYLSILNTLTAFVAGESRDGSSEAFSRCNMPTPAPG